MITDEVLLVYYLVLLWEDDNEIDLFSSFENSTDSVYMLMRVADKIENGGAPNMSSNPRDWSLFILNEFIEYADDSGINNIKSIIKQSDRREVADRFEVLSLQPQETWPANNLADTQFALNQLINSFIIPTLTATTK